MPRRTTTLPRAFSRVALNDPGDNVALAGRELSVDPFVFSVAEALQHHLSRGGCRDATESSGVSSHSLMTLPSASVSRTMT